MSYLNFGGSSVILCDHSNTERGYLKVLKEKLQAAAPSVTVLVSTVDKDPLQVV
jgi:putative NIF3 family GTP cyclohydrolase 1 type 2